MMRNKVAWGRRAGWLPSAVALLASLGLASLEGAEETPGVAVGKSAPSFALPNQAGTVHQLKDLLEEGQMLAVVFHRSADW